MSNPSDKLDAASRPIEAFNRQLLNSVARPLDLDAGFDLTEILRSLTAGLAQDSGHWLEIQNRYYRKRLELWAAYAQPHPGEPAQPVIEPDASDRRFRAPEWRREPYFDYLSQVLPAHGSMAARNRGRRQGRAASETQDRVLHAAVRRCHVASQLRLEQSRGDKLATETEGESVATGMRNLAADLDKGMISMTDESAFEVGRNLAVTPGAVIYENDFMQLIQYRPATDTVLERPLVMVPPCINKYYILDLQPENSFVRYAVERGHTVFMVSWRNMPPEMGRATWDDYLEHGVMKALSVAAEVCGVGTSQRARFLRRRHAARRGARRAARAGRGSRREPHPARHHARFQRHRRAFACSSTKPMSRSASTISRRAACCPGGNSR